MSMIKLYKVVFLQGENTGAVGKFPLVISRSGVGQMGADLDLNLSADPPIVMYIS